MDEEDYSALKEEVKNAKEPKYAKFLDKKYEDFLKRENRNIISMVGKQGELLKKFKKSGEFSSRVGLSRSNIYFKIRLYKFLCKFPKLKNSSYFKSNFKLIKKVCKADIFGEKK